MAATNQRPTYPYVAVGVICAVLICAGHLWGVGSGLFLDDHAHFKHLSEDDWSYQWAVRASRLGVVGDVLDIWSKRESGLLFYRPIAFWTMKLGYTLVGWQPAGMHVISLVWHWVAAMLLGRVAFGFLGHRVWAAVAAGVFAVHPGNVVTVYWIATQSELLVTVCLLGATLCYAKYSGWRVPWLDGRTPPETPVRWPYLIPTLALYAAALGCRENAVMLLPTLLIADVAFGLRLRRWPAYVALVSLLAAYFVLRTAALDGFPLPERPYLIRPGEPDFLPFVVSKFAHYCLGLFAYVPIIPVGGQVYFEQRLLTFILSFAGVVLGWVLLAVFVRRRGLAFPFAWLMTAMVPMLPVFSSPHHLYLPSVAVGLILATALALGAGHLRRKPGPPSPARELGALVAVGLHAVGLTLGTWAMGWVYRSTTVIEDQFIEDVATLGHERRAIKPGDHLFFINLPTMAYYAIPALEQRIGVRDLHGHVLTFSPSPLLMEHPSFVRQLDDRTLQIEVRGAGYFAGTAGKVLVEAMGFDYPFRAGQVFDADLYRVRIDATDGEGVTRLTLVFDQPLADESYHFFFTSRARMAYPLLLAENTEYKTQNTKHKTQIGRGASGSSLERNEK